VLHRSVLLLRWLWLLWLLQSLPLGGRTTLDVGGAEALLCRLGRGAQWLPSYLGRKRMHGKDIMKFQ
jgi:hypothetical protein